MRAILYTLQTLAILSVTASHKHTVLKRNRHDTLPKRENRSIPEADKPDSDYRILNGTKASISDFPYVARTSVALTFPPGATISCGGTFISPRVVVTAAHCLFDITGKPAKSDLVSVYAGTTKGVHNDDFRFFASKIVTHPEYNNETLVNDIGLVFLPIDIPSDLAKPAKIFNGEVFDGMPVATFGWGLTNGSMSADSSEDLLYVGFSISSSENCKKNNEFWDGNSGKQICTGYVQGKGICYGDSGGPLAATNISTYPVVGFAIQNNGTAQYTGNQCGGPDDTQYFLRLSSYMDWIVENADLLPIEISYTKQEPSKANAPSIGEPLVMQGTRSNVG